MTPRAADVSEVDPGAWVSLPCIRLLVHPTYPGGMVGSLPPPTIPGIYTLPPYPAYTPSPIPGMYTTQHATHMGGEAGLCAEGVYQPWKKRQDYAQRG